MGSSNRLIVSILVVAALAVGFWVLLLGPKREEANKLATEVEQQQVALAEAQSKVAEATAAKREFPIDYRQLVVLGKAVPDSDETASLFVQVNRIADRSRLAFESILLNTSGASSTPEAAAPPATPAPTPSAPEAPAASASTASAVPAAATIPPTEAAASVLPLGATIGTAGLAVMPYNLNFSGDFFDIADFIDGIDSLVDTGGPEVAVDGRLITLDGFSLIADPELGFPHLDANFTVTTYLSPPAQGVTAGATPTEPAPSTATPTATAPATEPVEAESTTVAGEQ